MTKLLDEEPTMFEETIQKKQWKEAMMEEHRSIMKNDVWEIVPRPKEKSIVTSKWIYKIKHTIDRSVGKYKERFIASVTYPLPKSNFSCLLLNQKP